MTQKLKRYDLYDSNFYPCHRVEESINGKFVTYEDYQKLLEQLGKAEKILNDFCLNHKTEAELLENTELTSDSGGGNEDDCFMSGYLQADACAALKCRQYFKEKENK